MRYMSGIAVVVITFLVCFTLPNAAEATPVGLQSLPMFAYSYNSDSYPYGGSTIDDVYMSIYGSVWLAKPYPSPDTFLHASSTTQPVGTYGVGASLSSLGYAGSYILGFDYHLKTFDSANWDVFKVVITQGNYIWAGGTEVGGWSWGGMNMGGLETLDIDSRIFVPVVVAPALDYYLNVVLVTNFDVYNASWGRFSDVTVEGVPAVPEPATMILLGAGLAGLGLFGRRRFNK